MEAAMLKDEFDGLKIKFVRFHNAIQIGVGSPMQTLLAGKARIERIRGSVLIESKDIHGVTHRAEVPDGAIQIIEYE